MTETLPKTIHTLACVPIKHETLSLSSFRNSTEVTFFKLEPISYDEAVTNAIINYPITSIAIKKGEESSDEKETNLELRKELEEQINYTEKIEEHYLMALEKKDKKWEIFVEDKISEMEAKFSSMIANLESRVAKREKENLELTLQFSTLKEQNTKLSSNVTNLEEETFKLSLVVSNLKEETLKLSSVISNLKEETLKLSLVVFNLKEEKFILSSAVSNLKEENLKLNSSIRLLHKDGFPIEKIGLNDELTRKYETLKTDIDLTNTNLENIKEDLDKMSFKFISKKCRINFMAGSNFLKKVICAMCGLRKIERETLFIAKELDKQAILDNIVELWKKMDKIRNKIAHQDAICVFQEYLDDATMDEIQEVSATLTTTRDEFTDFQMLNDYIESQFKLFNK